MTASFRALVAIPSVVAIIVAANLVSASVASGADPILLIADDTAELTCRLTCDVTTVRRGQGFTLTSTLANPGNRQGSLGVLGLVVYNPFLKTRELENAQLRVFRADGTYVGDLFASSLIGGPRDAKLEDFVELPIDGEVGAKLRFTAMEFRSLNVQPLSQPPGKYRLQISFRSNVIAPHGILNSTPDRAAAALVGFQQRTDYAPNAVVSNVVDLEVLEGEPTPAGAPR